MGTEYRPLTEEEKNLHLNMLEDTGSSGIMGLSEANFLDTNQILNDNNTIDNSIINPIYSGVPHNPTNSTDSIFKGNGLYLNFSNGTSSRDYSINDFTIFNPYIHYMNNPKGGSGRLTKTPYAFLIDTSSFINTAVNRFNIYSIQYRTW